MAQLRGPDWDISAVFSPPAQTRAVPRSCSQGPTPPPHTGGFAPSCKNFLYSLFLLYLLTFPCPKQVTQLNPKPYSQLLQSEEPQSHTAKDMVTGRMEAIRPRMQYSTGNNGHVPLFPTLLDYLTLQSASSLFCSLFPLSRKVVWDMT